ncbi:LamB/YcsF family protein [compost metagenome]
MIHDPELLVKRVIEMVSEGCLTSTSGKRLEVPIGSVCVHGDTPGAVVMARQLRGALEKAGWVIGASV